jgi:hypothetical protein
VGDPQDLDLPGTWQRHELHNNPEPFSVYLLLVGVVTGLKGVRGDWLHGPCPFSWRHKAREVFLVGSLTMMATPKIFPSSSSSSCAGTDWNEVKGGDRLPVRLLGWI